MQQKQNKEQPTLIVTLLREIHIGDIFHARNTTITRYTEYLIKWPFLLQIKAITINIYIHFVFKIN